eukprot:TRINITY_DN13803_c0_g2_i2.p1 TRINITY_DN13803_c0_g2~~TRINITY_DN13803_c0_g2_i2.p1  ORF type:complete len:367 (+),score=53.83 TRINITY_DN13803_c0_g2_i2:89-1189(+)
MEALRMPLQCSNIQTTRRGASFEYPGLWSIPPSLAGATLVVFSSRWPHFLTEKVLHEFTLQVLMALFGLAVMSSAYPTYRMQALAASQEVQKMLEVVPAHRHEFDREVGKTLYVACLSMTVQGVLYGACAWWVFEHLPAALIFGLAGGGNAFGSAVQKHFLLVLFALCDKNIDTFIATNFPEIDQGEANGYAKKTVDWRKVAKAHYALDSRLQRLWSYGPGAMLLGFNLARDFALGGLLLVIGTVVQHPVHMKFALWGVGAFMLSVAAMVLMRAASVTSLCTTTTTFSGRVSIGSSVNFATCHARMTKEDEITNNTFLQYLSHTQVGVHLFGILLSPSLVLHIFMLMGSSLPIAVGILQSLMTRVG